MTQLESLDVGSNIVSSIPKHFSRLVNLKELNLSGNLLWGNLDAIYELENLETQVLSGNQIRVIGPEITKLTRLRHLDVLHHLLTGLPKEINGMRSLRSLWLDYEARAYL